MSLETLLIAMEANLDSIQSGRGKMLWKAHGDYFGAKGEEARTIEATFVFDGDHLRYDRRFNYGRAPRKDATNGKYWFEALYDADPPAVSLKLAGKDQGGRFEGEVIDIKRLMQPWEVDLKRFRQVAESGFLDGKASVTRGADGVFVVRIVLEERNRGLKLWVDPKKGFNITREQLDYKGHLLNDMRRTFQEIDGKWALKTFSWTRYYPESDRISGTEEVVVETLEVDCPIPAETFDLRGFDLPPKTRVTDEDKRITFRFNPAVAIEETIEETILDALTPKEATEPSPGPESPVTESMSPTTPHVADETGPKRDEGISDWGGIPFLLLAAAVIVLAVAVLIFWVKRVKSANK